MPEGYSYTLLLILLCPIGAVVGSFAHAIVKTINLEEPPTHEDDIQLASKDLRAKRGMWLTLRMILGAILGLVLGLYFVGSIQETPATLAKIVALSIIAGYAAPKFWEAQEAIVDAKLRDISKLSRESMSSDNADA